jgi:hypothetical protein
VVLAGFAWAAGSVYSNRRPIKTATSLESGMQMLAGGGLLLVAALVAGDFKRLNLAAASWVSLGAFAQGKGGGQGKRPPKEPVKVIENRKENRPPPNNNRPKDDKPKKP